jgi:hypothetical protein
VAGHAFAGVNWVGSKPQGYFVRDALLNAKSLRDWVGAGEDITFAGVSRHLQGEPPGSALL